MNSFIATTCAVVLLAAQAPAKAQSFCVSDGQPVPVQLMERFINADCGNCWSDPATPQPGLRAVALDWIIPGGLGCGNTLRVPARVWLFPPLGCG